MLGTHLICGNSVLPSKFPGPRCARLTISEQVQYFRATAPRASKPQAYWKLTITIHLQHHSITNTTLHGRTHSELEHHAKDSTGVQRQKSFRGCSFFCTQDRLGFISSRHHSARR